MKSKKALLTMISVVFILLSQVLPVYAAQDGPLRMTYNNGLNLYQNANSSSTVLMSMGLGEALAYLDYSGNWQKLRGWKYTTSSIVNGWSNGNIASAGSVGAKVALNIYRSESETPSGYEVPTNASINVGEYGQYLYSNLLYLRLYNYYSGGIYVTAYDFDSDGTVFVHTNFRTTSPSNYYLQLNPLS
ncbi:hypothetical protein [Desulfosporosinus shakirovi]|uniref:hypothetical protein n=1 Tax=Desulfosporosinus shakirovi TaxID=2885154 RepID=UPI001E4EDE70|nr:hypothetical protein [Desulfosporosinus sp. SRJS8]MCB8818099.1 hypothetical protein [Desulfosporosinus sp. SRJS8]